MAPEVMCKQNHGVSVDYYAVGIIAYECMMGRRPYNGKNRKEIRELILAKQIKIDDRAKLQADLECIHGTLEEITGEIYRIAEELGAEL